MDELGQLRRDAVENFVRGYGASTPFHADTGGTYYRSRASAELVRQARVINPTNARAAGIRGGLLRSLQVGKIWPSIGANLFSGSPSWKYALRASGTVAGAYALWEIGTGASKWLQPVQMTAEAVDVTKTRVFSTGTGGCYAGPTGCSLAGNPSYPFLPPLALGAAMEYTNPSNGTTATAYSSEGKYLPKAQLDTEPAPGGLWCRMVAPDGEGDDSPWKKAFGTEGGNCFHTNRPSPQLDDWYYGTAAYYQGGDTLRTPFAPFKPGMGAEGFPEGADTYEDRIKTPDLPANPNPADLEAALEAAEQQPLRDFIDEALDAMPSPEDSTWEDPNYTPPQQDPNVSTFTMLNCRGFTAAQCVTGLQARNWNGSATTEVLPPEQADLTLPAEAVTTTTPPAGATVATDAAITIVTNPGPATMPLRVPEILPGETGEAYKQRLRDAGWPDGKILIDTLTADLADTDKGSSEVVKVDPAPPSAPPSTPTIRITQNPPNMPGVPAGGCSDKTIRAIDFGPLAAIDAGDGFPFGALEWVSELLGQLGGAGTAPRFEIDLGFADPLVIDLATYTPFMTNWVKPLVQWAAILGMTLTALALCFGMTPWGRSTGADPMPSDPEWDAVAESEFKGVRGWGR